MAVDIDVTALAAELRIGDGATAPAEPVNGILTRHLDAAAPIIEKWAPDAPDAVHNLAAVRLVGYWYDQPFAAANVSFANAMVNSGAASALREWRVSHSTVIDEWDGQATRSVESATRSGGNMATMPSVRLFRLPLQVPEITFATLPNMTGQQVADAGTEILAVTREGISTGAPVKCWQQVFHYAEPDRQFLAVAVPVGGAAPSHYRIQEAVVTNAWDLDLPDSSPILAWRDNTGEAVIDGAAYAVRWWPQLLAATGLTIFEWPLTG